MAGNHSSWTAAQDEGLMAETSGFHDECHGSHGSFAALETWGDSGLKSIHQ